MVIKAQNSQLKASWLKIFNQFLHKPKEKPMRIIVELVIIIFYRNFKPAITRQYRTNIV